MIKRLALALLKFDNWIKQQGLPAYIDAEVAWKNNNRGFTYEWTCRKCSTKSWGFVYGGCKKPGSCLSCGSQDIKQVET